MLNICLLIIVSAELHEILLKKNEVEKQNVQDQEEIKQLELEIENKKKSDEEEKQKIQELEKQ